MVTGKGSDTAYRAAELFGCQVAMMCALCTDLFFRNLFAPEHIRRMAKNTTVTDDLFLQVLQACPAGKKLLEKFTPERIRTEMKKVQS
jgi:hypothetical protein